METPTTTQPPLDCIDFSEALRALKAGKRIQRASWKNFKAFIYLRKNKFGRIFLVLHTMDKMPEKEWIPSVKDVLAEDWVIVQ